MLNKNRFPHILVFPKKNLLYSDSFTKLSGAYFNVQWTAHCIIHYIVCCFHFLVQSLTLYFTLQITPLYIKKNFNHYFEVSHVPCHIKNHIAKKLGFNLNQSPKGHKIARRWYMAFSHNPKYQNIIRVVQKNNHATQAAHRPLPMQLHQ